MFIVRTRTTVKEPQKTIYLYTTHLVGGCIAVTGEGLFREMLTGVSVLQVDG